MAEADDQKEGAAPRLRSVLVTTDCSPLGDRALRWAFALPEPGGVVHLLHVIEPSTTPNPLYAHYVPGRTPAPAEKEAQAQAIYERLAALVPESAAQRKLETRIEIVEDNDVVRAICAVAERLDVDAICIASQGRSGIVRALLGSVASRVLELSRRPVLVLRPELS